MAFGALLLHKAIFHNAFVVPVQIPAFGILDWSIEDVNTRTILTSVGNLHKNNNIKNNNINMNLRIDKRVWGVKLVQTAFKYYTVSLRQHLLDNSNKSKYINLVLKREEKNVLRVGSKLLRKHSLPDNLSYNFITAGLIYFKELDMKRSACSPWKKTIHGHVF